MEHLEKAAKNAKMVSWQMQNDKIECLSKFVRSKIKDETPDYYVIITNEVTDRFRNKEILLLCLHYVRFCANKEPYICETYFDSLHIQDYWEEYFATGQRNGIVLSKCRAEAYDEASAISSEVLRSILQQNKHTAKTLH